MYCSQETLTLIIANLLGQIYYIHNLYCSACSTWNLILMFIRKLFLLFFYLQKWNVYFVVAIVSFLNLQSIYAKCNIWQCKTFLRNECSAYKEWDWLHYENVENWWYTTSVFFPQSVNISDTLNLAIHYRDKINTSCRLQHNMGWNHFWIINFTTHL